jgi:hypothetical protein
MDTRRRVCLCRSADAPVLQWLRFIRYQTASETSEDIAAAHPVLVRDRIESKLIQSIGVDDDMSRNWLQSICPCLHRTSSLTDEQDQRLKLVTNQTSSTSSFTLPESEPIAIDDLLHKVSTCSGQVTPERAVGDSNRESKGEFVSPEIAVQTRKRHRPRHPTLPRISETTDSCQVVEENLKFARQTWIHFSQWFESDFCYLPPTVSLDRRSRLYSELCGVDDEASPLEDGKSWQHQRHSWPALVTRRYRSHCQWLSQSSIFLSVARDEKEEREKNPVAHILLHNSQSQTLEPQRVLTCANASEAFFWNDALVLRNRLSHPNNLAQVS